MTGRDWRYLAIAVKELARARLRHVTSPAGRIVEALQAPPPNAAAPVAVPDPVDLQRRARAIATAARIIPCRSDCLLQAMAADRWLRRDRLLPEFHLGVTKDDNGELQAHAWLSCAGVPVTGGDGAAYVPLLQPR